MSRPVNPRLTRSWASAAVNLFVVGAFLAACSSSVSNPSGSTASFPPLALQQGTSAIAVTSGSNNLRVLASGDGIEKPMWLPGHRDLAFLVPNYGLNPPANELWVLDVNTGTHWQVTNVYPEQIRYFSIGGPGPTVIYNDLGAIRRFTLAGLSSHVVPIPTSQPLIFDKNAVGLSISPSGTLFAYADNSSPPALYTASVSGGSRRLVFQGTDNVCLIDNPAWSPDGNWIAFSMCVEKGTLDAKTNIWLIRPNGTGLHELLRSPTLSTMANSNPTWSPSGDWIAFEGSPYRLGAGPSGLFRVHPDGTDFRAIAVVQKHSSTEYSTPAW